MLRPVMLRALGSRIESHLNAEIGHRLDHPLKIMGRNAVDVHVRHGVHEVDGVGNPIPDGELDAVHIVAQCAVEAASIFDDFLIHLGGKIVGFDHMKSLFGVILDGHDRLPPNADTAYELIPFDEFLQDHAACARLVVGLDQLVDCIDLVYMMPAVPCILENGRLSDIVEKRVPVERIGQIAEAFIDHAFRVFLHWEHSGSGAGHPQPIGQAGCEVFIISPPPKWVVDDIGTLQNRVLQVGTIVGDFVANAI